MLRVRACCTPKKFSFINTTMGVCSYFFNSLFYGTLNPDAINVRRYEASININCTVKNNNLQGRK